MAFALDHYFSFKILKWYVRFSKPVNPAKIYDHIHLINNEDNVEVDRALLPLETPLLSEDGTLLTLWIEPGRQKRDLGPNRELGEVLTPGKSYTLVIDKDLKDREGISIQADYIHSFTVASPDRVQPTITSWVIEIPKNNTKESLRILLQESLDYGSLQNSLQLVDYSGEIVEGEFEIRTNYKNIVFKPLQNWKRGSYVIQCKPVIEDLAGNNLERLFDRDVTVEEIGAVLELSFVVK